MPSSPLKGDETDAQAKLITLFCKRADDPVNVDAKDRYGCTALHMASYKGNHAAVCDLLDCGADIEVCASIQTPFENVQINIIGCETCLLRYEKAKNHLILLSKSLKAQSFWVSISVSISFRRKFV